MMLTQQQKAEAEKKLKNISEELAIEEELKAAVSTPPPIQNATPKSYPTPSIVWPTIPNANSKSSATSPTTSYSPINAGPRTRSPAGLDHSGAG